MGNSLPEDNINIFQNIVCIKVMYGSFNTACQRVHRSSEEMSVYICPTCNKDFSQVEGALNHVNGHPKSQRGCVVPGCRYIKQARLSLHTRRKHRSSCQYPCSSCTKVFVRSADRSQHANDVHGSARVASAIIMPSTSFHSLHPMFNFHSTPNVVSQVSAMAIASGNEAFNLDSATSDVELNRFIDNHLQPTQSFNLEMNETVDKIVRFFQDKMSPSEIVKGGSMGKGTAIKRNADIDLLMILGMDRVNGAEQLKESLPDIKDEIERYLRNEQDRGFTVMLETIKTTKFFVQFSVKNGNNEIKVDLLPTFNFTDKHVLYEQMGNDPGDLSQFYSASLAKLQVAFVSPIPANVKNLIRLVKYWRKELVDVGSTGSRIPNSYVLELITIHLWESKGRPSHFNTLKAFHSVMETLADTQSISAIWSDNYNKSKIPPKILAQRPLVMDPANPFNNVCNIFSWEEIGKKANEALASRMLRDISSTTWS